MTITANDIANWPKYGVWSISPVSNGAPKVTISS